MYHLIMAVISIALIGFATAAQVQYINPQAMLVASWKKTLLNDLDNFEQGFSIYRRQNTRFVTHTFEDGEGATIEETQALFTKPRDINDLRTFIAPPTSPEGTSWRLGLAGGGVYLCLHGTFPEPLAQAVSELKQTNFTDGDMTAKFNYHHSCGAASSEALATRNMALTYWLIAPNA